jgi:glycosyltransferase involved in cell wall biosynthesis
VSVRVLFAQPSVQPPGGGNGVAAWMLQALHERFDVTLLTFEHFDPAPINRFYGTRLDARRIQVRRAASALFPLITRMPVPLGMLRTSLMMRAVQRVRGPFDLIVSANNEADFQTPGIQYIHYPWRLMPRPVADLRWYHVKPALDAYYALCDRVAPLTRAGVIGNLSLVNSDWTGRLMVRWYGDVPTRTLYPPVAGDFPSVPWEARSNGFACIGRIAPEKNLDRIFDIVGAVRRHLPDAHLHLIGTDGGSAYSRRILARAERERAWVTYHRGLRRQALAELVSRQRYGIHGMTDEHFGMGVAEMVRAGCIVWVPDDGGQVEIVGDERLTYHRDEDAVAKIVPVISDPARQALLRQHLAARGPRFSSARFTAELLEVVDEFLRRRREAPLTPPAA